MAIPPPHDALLQYISDDTPLGRRIKHRIEEEGYIVIPNVLTKEECSVELSRLWDFVEATSPGVCRNDPNSWYPEPKTSIISDEKDATTSTTPAAAQDDPWPHSGWHFLPDMCQSFQAGWLFGSLRERLADRIFEPLYGTSQLHSSKEGFTFHRPTAPGVASNGALHPVLDRERPRVCGKVQVRAMGEHFDQCAAHTGLQCIQSSTALIDQDMDGADGCFQCWPRSHVEHPRITKDIWRGRSDWVPLTDEELISLEERGMAAKKVPVNAGDVILWRSDLVHCGVGPSSPRTGFRAVSYTAMLPAAMTPMDVLEGKMDEYLNMQTGDHRPNVKSRHFAPPKNEKKQRGKDSKTRQRKSSDQPAVDNIKLARGQYFADGPPILTLRQAEMYGLIPYDRSDGDLDISSKVRFQSA
ncbi:hypothetical protein ACHAXR_013412 [Thalassiosira sp. AJA248-18]